MSRYLITSCTLWDSAGAAMISGFINGISKLDPHAHIMCLHKKEHHKEGWLNWFEEPFQNEEAVAWSDIIVNIAGLNTCQPNQYEFVALAQKHNKPLVWASQTFKSVDKGLLTAPRTKIVARGQRSANRLRNNGIPCHGIAPDLSFLVEPHYDGLNPVAYPKRVFSTHIIKDISKMRELCDEKTDIQIIEKEPQGGTIWEPYLDIITFDNGTPEEYFGLVARAEEVHCARYQVACAAILAGIKPVIYGTGDPEYDEKYVDLMDYYGKSPEKLRSEAMLSCEITWDLLNGLY